MPICRDCGNKETFYAVERVYTRFRFDPDTPEETCPHDSETTEYLDDDPLEYECGECNNMDIAVGEDVKDVVVSENEFIKGKINLTKELVSPTI